MAVNQPTKDESSSRRLTRERASTADQVSALQQDALATGEAGVRRINQARRDLETGERLNQGAAQLGARGVRDLTQANDAAVVAKRMGEVGKIVGQAGARDVEEGVELLVASEDIEGMSALVGLLSMGDLERSMQLARLSGEMRMVGQIVTRLQMPVLAAFLDSRGDRLNQAAIEFVVRAAATRALSTAMQVTGGQIRELSVEEIAEGVVRLAASELIEQGTNDLAADAAQQAVRGQGELEAA